MSINESSATAVVSVRGLSIGCFNPEKKRREIALIRDGQHQLSVKILKPSFIDGTGEDCLSYENVSSYRNLPDDVEISIKGVGNPAIEGYEVYETENFDRLNPNKENENDFRWLVNVAGDEMHGDNLVGSSNLDRFPLSRLVIENGLFYARDVNEDFYFEKVEIDADGNELKRSDFGNLAESTGVKIESDVVSFTIKVGEEEHTHLLPRTDGLPYKIEISNMNYAEDAPVSDMPTYYSYFADAEGRTFDFIQNTEAGKTFAKAATGRELCSGIEGGGEGFWATIFKYFFSRD